MEPSHVIVDIRAQTDSKRDLPHFRPCVQLALTVPHIKSPDQRTLFEKKT